MTTAAYAVEGLTCGFCIAKVMERVRLVPGVTGLSVARGPGGAGGPSQLIVTSGYAVAADEVRRAVEVAGFDLSRNPDGPTAPPQRRGPPGWDRPTRRRKKPSQGGVSRERR